MIQRNDSKPVRCKLLWQVLSSINTPTEILLNHVSHITEIDIENQFDRTEAD